MEQTLIDREEHKTQCAQFLQWFACHIFIVVCTMLILIDVVY